MSTQPTTPKARRKEPSSARLKYDPEPGRDIVRAAIAVGLVLAFLMTIGFAFYSTHGDYAKTKEMVDKLLPALTGLIGSALGFYFGMKNTQG
jgi:hypothetical protein